MCKTTRLSVVVFSALTAACVALANVDHWHGSKTIPPHRLKLKSPGGDTIVPGSDRAMPLSTSQTCGSCHDYKKISCGTHFKTSHAQEGRKVEPWIWVDAATGTQLPVTDDLGMTPWKFVRLFGRHMPGGGIGETRGNPADPDERWNISGALEINCLGCHNASPRQDQSEWAKQIARENLRWAGTAASGLGDVSSMASRIKGDWDIYDGPNLDDRLFADPPAVKYDENIFDAKSRVFLEVGRPDDRRCLYCHSTYEVGIRRIDDQSDVHAAAGLKCVDCHRNGLDHKIIRGYETEGVEHEDATVASSSCKGCHMQTGRYGAPKPRHRGLPPVHLKKLSCTACHTGPMLYDGPVKVQTARSNRLGIYGRAQWALDHPGIQAPVLAKAEDGKITPHNIMWPAYWGRMAGDKINKLDPGTIPTAGILDAEKYVGDILELMVLQPLELKALIYADDDVYAKPAFINDGKLYGRNIDGELDEVAFKGTVPSDIGSFAYLTEEDEPKLIPLVQKWNADLGVFGKDADAQTPFVKVLGRILNSTRCVGEPVIAQAGKLYRLESVKFIDVSDREVAELSERNEMAQKAKLAEMKARSIEIAGGNYYRKTDWKYKKIFLRKEKDLVDLEELADIAARAQSDMDRIALFGKSAYAKCVRVTNSDIADLKKAAQDKKAKLDAALKEKSIVIEDNKYFKIEGDKKTRIYIMREEKSLFEMVLLAEIEQKKVDSIREHEGINYKQVFEGDKFIDKAILEFKPGSVSDGSFTLGWLADGKPVPMVPDFMKRAITATDKVVELFTEDQVAETLKKLDKEGGEPVYIASGKLFKLDGAGKLVASDHDAAKPVMWPIAHNVRPATQALGAKKCTDCHASKAPFFFAEVAAMGPMVTEHAAVVSMSKFMDVKDGFHRLFGLSFTVRPLFKLAMLGIAALATAVLALYFLLGLDWVTKRISLLLIEKLCVFFGMLSAVVLTATGFCTAVCLGRELSGFSLLSHTACGGLFAACIAVLAVLRAKACVLANGDDKRFCICQKLAFWVIIASTIGLVATILIAMVPVLDTHGQHVTIVLHRYLAIVTVVAAAIYGIFAKKRG